MEIRPSDLSQQGPQLVVSIFQSGNHCPRLRPAVVDHRDGLSQHVKAMSYVLVCRPRRWLWPCPGPWIASETMQRSDAGSEVNVNISVPAVEAALVADLVEVARAEVAPAITHGCQLSFDWGAQSLREHCSSAWVSVGAPTVCVVVRRTVKLLLVDSDQRLLLVCGRDTATDLCHWYPVGGGIESGESPAQAAKREAWEETGLEGLADGTPVWTREATYTYSGKTYEVHETWLLYPVEHFDPAPKGLTEYEKESIVDFRWWTVDDLRATRESIYPPTLGDHFASLQMNGHPLIPIDIGGPHTTADV